MNRKEAEQRLAKAYETERFRLTARVRRSGRSREDAEDLIQEVYAETWGRMDALMRIANLPAWLNSLVTRRLIDTWRHDRVRRRVGETDVAEETIREVIAGTGLNPLDAFVREAMVEAMDDAMKALPGPQRRVLEAQVFGGLSFSELAARTGESIDTLKARKRYAVANLSAALKHWIEE